MLLCIFLFTVALFVTTMTAKLLASYFHKQAFFDKMQMTLKQARHPPPAVCSTPLRHAFTLAVLFS